MNFLEALQIDHNTAAVDGLTTALRSDDLPSDVQSDARAIVSQMEVIDGALDDFRSEVATLPDYFGSRQYTVEYARELTIERNLEVIRRNDPARAIDRLEQRTKAFLGELADKSRPIPPTPDAALLEALLMGARQDARDALSNTQSNLAETILNLQTEALENGEDSLAYLLGATPWAARYVKANSTPEEQISFDKIAGTLRDNVSDPSATPYRQAAERLAELDTVPDGYRAAWKWAVEESGLLLPEVKTALGL